MTRFIKHSLSRVHSIEGLRGAAIVTRAGRVKLEVASGLADAGAGATCTPRTRFQLASVSKQFAAVAVLLLAESEKLGLAEPWRDGFPAARGSGSRSRSIIC